MKHETPDSALGAGREKLARVLQDLDRLVRLSIAQLDSVKAENLDLSQRIEAVQQLYDQERSNTEQRERLYQSTTSEVRERSTAYERLAASKEELEIQLKDQTARIARLEDRQMELQEELRAAAQHQIAHKEERERLEKTIATLTERSNVLEAERNELKENVYELTRTSAGWKVRLSKEEQASAAESIDNMLARLAQLEEQITSAT